MKLKTTDDLSGGGAGNFLSKPGIYHLLVTEAYEGTTPKGDMYEGVVLTCSALEGNVRDASDAFTERDKTVNVRFRAPSMADKDGGTFALKVLSALALACDLVTPQQLGSELDVDFTKCRGKQVVMKIRQSDPNPSTGKQYLELSFSDVWHVDDPRTVGIPKSADHLGVVAKANRHDAAYFASVVEKKAAAAKKEEEIDYSAI